VAMAKNKESRTFNISVVGLSGTEKEKGATGIGKSCLCNRFVRPRADDYFEVHTSLISQSDFGGRVVNNDQFLYWGEVRRIDEGCEYIFRVVEQTEFIDDATFQPHRSTNLQPYSKRSVAIKLSSAEKLMYICTDQLGIEQDFEQKQMPDGKLAVDGFLLCCDVTLVQNRPLDDQLEFISNLYKQLSKTKKPVVLVATKCDVMVEQFLRELQAYLSKAKINTPVIETSAHENVNVELAFIALAQMIDKSRGKPKIIPFAEASRQQRDILDVVTDKYTKLLTRAVKDFHAEWHTESNKIKDSKDYQDFVYLRGEKQARELFRRHLRKLKDDFVCRKKLDYLTSLLKALEIILPDLDEIEHMSWEHIQELLFHKQEFDSFFIVLQEESWQDSDHIENPNDQRIPFDFLQLSDAELVSQEHLKRLKIQRWKADMKVRFKKALEWNNQVTPGKAWEDVHIFLLDEESFQQLSDQEKLEIYSRHQQDIIEKAKEEFQEMLLEYSDLFVDLDLNATPSKEKMTEINRELKDEPRFKALQRLEAERQALLLKHIGFIYHPTIDTCLSGQNCMDIQIQQNLANHASQCTNRSRSTYMSDSVNTDKLNIVLLGCDGLAHELANEIMAQSTDNEYALDGKMYELELRPIEENARLSANPFQTSSAKPHGCFCVFNSIETLQYIEENLDSSTGFHYSDKRDKTSHLPIALILAHETWVLATLRLQGKHIANKMQCHFVDVPSDTYPYRKFHELQIKQALRELLEAKKCRPSVVSPAPSLKELPEVDLRIMMCVMCGDSFSVDLVLTPFLESQFCTIGKIGHSCTLVLEVFLGSHKRRVEIAPISYHSAMMRRDEMVHGYILVYSAKRKASIAMLRAFLSGVPDVLPIHILAVTDTDCDFFTDEISKDLLMEGEQIASDIGAKFKTTSRFYKQTEMFTAYFREVYEQKLHIEESMSLWETGDESLPQSAGVELQGFNSNSQAPDDSEPPPPYSPASNEKQPFPLNMSDMFQFSVAEKEFSGGIATVPPYGSPLCSHEYLTDRSYKIGPPVLPKPVLPPRPDPELLKRMETLRFGGESIRKSLRQTPSESDPGDYADPLDAISRFRNLEENIYSVPQDSKQGKIIRIRGRPVYQARKPVPYKHRSERLKPRRTAPPELLATGSPSEGSDEEVQNFFPSLSRRKRKPRMSDSDLDKPSADQDDRKKKKSLLRKSKEFKPTAKYRKQEVKKESVYFGLPLVEVVQSPDNPIPLFVEKCVLYLESCGITTEGLYRVSGNKTEQDSLQKQFECDHSISYEAMDVNVNTVAGSLKIFFAELPDPLLPYDIHQDLMEAINIPDKTGRLLALRGKLKKLPHVNHEVFKYIITHLHKVSQYSSENYMTSENLSICFWPTLMRPDFQTVDALTATRVNKLIIETFIHQCPFFFYNQDEVVDGPMSAPGSPAVVASAHPAGSTESHSEPPDEVVPHPPPPPPPPLLAGEREAARQLGVPHTT
uniref:Rho GTPase activating protein 5 n=1 Tax=Petromyzon marinus TaxID=7757 RepID=S4RJ88_PETMA